MRMKMFAVTMIMALLVGLPMLFARRRARVRMRTNGSEVLSEDERLYDTEDFMD